MTLYPAIPPLSRHHSAIVAREGRRMGGYYPAAILLPIGGGGIGRRFIESSIDAYPAESRRKTGESA